MLTLETAKISFTPNNGGEKKELNQEEKIEFIKNHLKNSRLVQAFMVGINVGSDEGSYKLENSEYMKKTK